VTSKRRSRGTIRRFVKELPLFGVKGVIRGILSVLWFIEALAWALNVVFTGHFVDSDVSCRSDTFVPFLVLWLCFARHLEPSV